MMTSIIIYERKKSLHIILRSYKTIVCIIGAKTLGGWRSVGMVITISFCCTNRNHHTMHCIPLVECLLSMLTSKIIMYMSESCKRQTVKHVEVLKYYSSSLQFSTYNIIIPPALYMSPPMTAMGIMPIAFSFFTGTSTCLCLGNLCGWGKGHNYYSGSQT